MTADVLLGADAPAPAPTTAARARTRAVPGLGTLSLALAVGVIVLVLAFSIAPGLFTNHDPAVGIPREKFTPPGTEFWLGSDHLGRDLLSRIIHGSASSMSSAVIAVAIGLAVGGVLGLLSGFLGGVVDAVIGRVVDVLLAIPSFLLAVVIVTALGFDTRNAAIATGISAVAVFARLMRAEVIGVRGSVYVEAAYVTGGSRISVLLQHVLPNAVRPVLSLAVLQFGLAILTIASLAFLGYGDAPPASDWGLLVATGRDYLVHAPWLVVVPGVVIAVVVLSVARISRALGTTSR